MIDTFYKTVQNVLNKNQMGKISPSEFNSLASQALKTVQVESFTDYKKLNNKKSRLQETPNYGSESFNLKQVIEYWIEEDEFDLDENGKVELPENVFLVNSIFGADAQFTYTELLQFNRLTRSGRMKPSKCSPIYAYHNGTVKVAPIIAKVDITYYRTVKTPKWTYNIVAGKEMFNPNANGYQDLDMHPMLLHRLFVEVLSLAGVNLRDEYVTQAVSQMKQVEFANEQ